MPMEFILLPILAVLIVFMFVNTRKRQKQMKAEQEEKATKTVPGVKVLLQGGIYGTIVAYDHDDLDSPALVEIAPGTVIEVHSQAILRVVDPVEGVVTEDEFIEAEASEAEYIAGVADGDITSISDDHKYSSHSDEVENDKKDKPEA